MSVIYFHIGPHKTGTTSIQSFLDANREWLHSLGFSYPTYLLSEPFHDFHSLFMEYDKNFDNWFNQFKELRYAYSIISSETFFNRTFSKQKKSIFDSLRSLSDIKLIGVLCLRPQDELIHSQWAQAVKHGELDICLRDYVELCLANKLEVLNGGRSTDWFIYPKYSTIISDVQDYFDEIKIFVHSKDHSETLRRFLTCLEINITKDTINELKRPFKQNITPSYKTLEYVRTIISQLNTKFSTEERKVIAQMIKREASLRGFNNSIKYGYDKELIKSIRQHFEYDNQIINRELSPDFHINWRLDKFESGHQLVDEYELNQVHVALLNRLKNKQAFNISG